MSQQPPAPARQSAQSGPLNYLLYLPQGYDPAAPARWPLVLFLHGIGERGTDLERVKVHGIARVVEERDDLPFIAVSPQCPADSLWPTEVEALDALLRQVTAQHAVDPERIYLTGLSMGGYGAWHLAVAYPERFAAVVPICGGGMAYAGFPEAVRRLQRVPIWVFHGAKDDRVLLEESLRLVRELEAGGGNVRLTVYPEAGHDSWTETYRNPELYEWLLRQRASCPPPPRRA